MEKAVTGGGGGEKGKPTDLGDKRSVGISIRGFFSLFSLPPLSTFDNFTLGGDFEIPRNHAQI